MTARITPTKARVKVDPLTVVCPVCERKAGYPCENLGPGSHARSWVVDSVRGGLSGPDRKHVHPERTAAAKEATV